MRSSSVGTRDYGTTPSCRTQTAFESELQEGKVSTGCTTKPRKAADSMIGMTTSAGKRRLLLCFYRGKESGSFIATEGEQNTQAVDGKSRSKPRCQRNAVDSRRKPDGPAREWNEVWL